MKFSKITLVIALAFILFSRIPALATEIGVIDLKKAWTKYEKAIKIDEQLDKKEVDIEKQVIDLKRKIADGKTPLEKKNLQDRYTKQINEKLSTVKKWYIAEQRKLDSTMKETIKQVALQKKLNTILVKKAVVYGGTDITDDVIKILNK